MAKLEFDAASEEYAPSGFEPIPAGKYQAVVVQSDYLPTSKGGKYVKLQWQIIDGVHANRVIFSNHNVINNNETAERMARQDLRAFADAMNVEPFHDTEQLHGRPVMIRVIIETKDGYAPKNVVKGAYPVGKYQAPSQGHGPTGSAPPSQGFVSTGAMSAGSIGSSNGGQTPAHVAAAANAGTFTGTGARAKPAAGNTRENPFVE